MSMPERDRSVAIVAFGTALSMLAAHIVGKVARDALFLSNFPVTALPNAMIGAAVFSLGGAAAMSRLLARGGPARVVPVAFGLSGLLFVLEWWLLGLAPRLTAVILYLHYAALGAVLISGFWSIINERFDPHSAKRTIARVGGFATLGGVVGGLAAERISALFGLAAMFPVLAALHVGCGLALRATTAGATGPGHAREAEAGATASGLRTLVSQPLLLQMAVLVAGYAVIDALLDYALKAEASARFEGGEGLGRFFAIFYTAAGLLAFALQASLGERVLKKLGLGGSMALLPGAVVLTGALGSVFARLGTVVLASGSAFALGNSFFRAGFELLYTPIPPAVKRPTKAYIDVGGQRLGDMVGGGLILLLLFLLPTLPTFVLLGLAAIGGVGLLVLVARLHQGYVSQLADSVRSGAVSIQESEIVDATTARTLAETHLTIDRAELLARIRELQRAETEEDGPEVDSTISGTTGAPARLHGYFDAVAALESGRIQAAREALAASGDDLRLVPHVIGSLVRFDLLDDALAFLGRQTPRAVGQLTDALLDPESDVLVRRRLPRVLETCDAPRALEGLLLGLDDRDFEVRLECARAAARLTTRKSALRPEAERIYALVERELRVDDMTWERQGRRREDGAAESVLLDEAEFPHVNRSAELVFTLLGVVLGTELMASALRGLFKGDAYVQGTALEYLEITLPEGLRGALWPRIPGAVPTTHPRRGSKEVADELLRSSLDLRKKR